MPIDSSIYFQQQSPDIIGSVEKGLRMSDMVHKNNLARDEEQKANGIADIDEEIDDTYKIHFHSQLLDYHRAIALYNGTNVTITKEYKDSGYDSDRKWQNDSVKIIMPDKTEQWVDVVEMDFPFNLTKE